MSRIPVSIYHVIQLRPSSSLTYPALGSVTSILTSDCFSDITFVFRSRTLMHNFMFKQPSTLRNISSLSSYELHQNQTYFNIFYSIENSDNLYRFSILENGEWNFGNIYSPNQHIRLERFPIPFVHLTQNPYGFAFNVKFNPLDFFEPFNLPSLSFTANLQLKNNSFVRWIESDLE